MRFSDFLEELQKRKLIRELSVYAVTSWLVIQVAAVTHDYLGVPKYSVTLVIILLLLGFPAYMYYAWKHDVIADLKGEREEEQEPETPYQQLSGKFFLRFLGVTTIAIIALSAFIFKENFLDIRNLQLADNDRVAISIFENNTGDQQYDYIGNIISDHLARGITSNNFGNVVSYATISRQTTLLASMPGTSSFSTAFGKETGASKIIEGAYHTENDELIIQANIVDGNSGEIKYSFKPIRCKINSPSMGVSELEQKVLGFWFSQLREPNIQLAPKYDAYRLYLDALGVYNKDYDKTLELLNKSIQLDSNFVQPHFVKASIYYDLNQHELLEELVKQLDERSLSYTLQEKNMIEFYSMLSERNYAAAVKAFQKEYAYHPNELHTNTSMAVIYADMVNQPAKVLETLNEYRGSDINYDNCYYCQTRINLEARALIKLNRPEEALQVLDSEEVQTPVRRLYQSRIKALSKMEKFEEVDMILNDPRIRNLRLNYKYLFLVAANEALLSGNVEKSKYFAEKAWDQYKNEEGYNRTKSQIQYLMGNLENTKRYITEFLENRPNDINANVMLATLHLKQGDEKTASEIIKKVEALESERYNGEKFYELGKYYAIEGNEKVASDYLKGALQQGMIFYSSYFDGDPELVQNLTTEALSGVLEYYKEG